VRVLMNLDELVKRFDEISRMFGEWMVAPQLVIRARHDWSTRDSRFYAMFENVWISEGENGGAVASYGNGSTPEEAMQDYMRIINGKTLILHINYENEKQVVVT